MAELRFFVGCRPLAFAVAAMIMAPAAGTAEDWEQWRGPQRTGQSSDFEPPGAWPDHLAPQWETVVGGGDASPLISGERIYTWTREGDDEVAAAYDRRDGSLQWEARNTVPFKAMVIVGLHGAGPYSTPALADGRLFTVGILGDVTAFGVDTGEKLWRREFTKKDFKMPRPFYGASQSPLVVDDVVIASVGGPSGGALIAFDQETGKDRWRLDLEGPSYGSGLIAEIAGKRQLVTPTRKRLVGVDLASGEQLWEHPFEVRSDDWSQTPLIIGNLILLSTGKGPSIGLEISQQDDRWTAKERWSSNDFWLRFSSPVRLGDRVFGFAEQKKGHLVAIDPSNGDLLWEGLGGRVRRAG